jgi:hypothetical protein
VFAWVVVTLVVASSCAAEDRSPNARVDASGQEVRFSGGATGARQNPDRSYSAYIEGTASASIATFWQFGHDRGTNVTAIEGLQPGDDVLLGRSAEAPGRLDLPSDCTCDTTGTVDLNAVDAIAFSVSDGSPYPTPNQGTSTTRTTIYRAFSWVPADQFILFTCTEHSWDDLRPVIAASRCASR